MDHGVGDELASDDSIGGCHADPASGGSSRPSIPTGRSWRRRGEAEMSWTSWARA